MRLYGVLFKGAAGAAHYSFSAGLTGRAGRGIRRPNPFKSIDMKRLFEALASAAGADRACGGQMGRIFETMDGPGFIFAYKRGLSAPQGRAGARRYFLSLCTKPEQSAVRPSFGRGLLFLI